MRKTMKKYTVLCVMLAGLLAFLPALSAGNVVRAAEQPTSGVWRNNFTWELDTETGALTISGTGAMYNPQEEACLEEVDAYNRRTRFSPWLMDERIKSVKFEGNITNIGNFAFYGCRSLRSVELPDTLKRIGYHAFECTALQEVELPDTVQTVEQYAFQCCGLKRVRLSRSLKGISLQSFCGCGGLQSVEIPDSVTYIGASAFQSAGLTGVTLPASVRTIGTGAFQNCASLRRIVIKNAGTERIDSSFLKGCTSLERIEFAGSEADWNSLLPGFELPSVNCAVVFGEILESVKIASLPSRTSYVAGDSLETKGLKLTAVYDSRTETVTGGFSCTPTKLTQTGKQTVTVSYRGQTATFTVDVAALAVQSVTVKTLPSKTVYEVGDAIDAGGLILRVGYNNGTSYDVGGGYTFTPKTLTRAGTQTVTVTYQGKTATFSVKAVSGIEITGQPKDVTGAVGDKVTFSVAADGVGLRYQWYYRKADAAGWTAWKNGTSATLTAPVYASWHGAKFYCKMTDQRGETVNSGTARMLVATKILAQPTDASAAIEEKVTFSVKVTGAGLKYQWYYKKTGDSYWTKWNKRTSATLTAPIYASWNGAKVFCKITDASGKTINSGSAKMFVTTKITRQPSDASVKAGGKANFSVQATGAGLKYQWYYRKSGATYWSKWSGKTSPTLSATFAKSWNGAKVFCKITDANGTTLNSGSAKISVK